MPKISIEKSIFINKPVNQVFTKLNDFNHWSTWSPWLILEEGVKVEVADDKKFYSWLGDITGEGNMKITSEVENESIDIDLNFLKPWKSKAKVGFILKTEGEGTRVRWTMDSSLPFFMFFMKKMMETFVGMDYDRGLNLLKDYTEDGKVHSKLHFKGYETFEGCNFIGIKTTCTLDEMPEKMKDSFATLMEFMHKDKENIGGDPFSSYHKWDPVKNSVSFTCCAPYKKLPTDLPEGVITGSLPKVKVHVIGHDGPYRHAGNVWSAQYGRQRAKKFKLNKSVDPFEVYLNSPKNTTELELKTEVYFPVK